MPVEKVLELLLKFAQFLYEIIKDLRNRTKK